MEMGLCFVCDEPFTVDHALKHKRIRFKVIEMNDEIERDFSHKPSTLNHNLISTHSYVPELGCSSVSDGAKPPPAKDEEVQGMVEDSQQSSIYTQKTPSSTTNYDTVWDSKSSTSKIDVVSVVPTAIMSTINHAVTKSLKPTSVNQQHSTISSPMPLTMQLPKGISISPCKFPVGLSAFTQNHSSPSNLQRLSGVELKCFDPGGMIPLLFLPISSVFISVQFPSRESMPIPPEPPDWVAVQASSLKLPLCVTTEGIATTQYLDMHSIPILLIVLQVFDQMPKGDSHKAFLDFLRSSWQLQCYLEELAAIRESNGLIKTLLQHSQELTHELQLVHTWSYLSDLFHDVCLYALANIDSYFNDSERGRIFDFVFKAGGIKHIIGELLDKHLISQWYEAKEVRFCAPNFLLFLLSIFGSKSWIMNLVYEEFQSLFLISLGSSVGTHELVQITDGKNMEVPNIYDCVQEHANTFKKNGSFDSLDIVEINLQQVHELSIALYIHIWSYFNTLFYDDYWSVWKDHHYYFNHNASLIVEVAFTFKMIARTYGSELMMVMSYGENWYFDNFFCVINKLGYYRYMEDAELVIQVYVLLSSICVTEDLWAEAKLDIGTSMLVHVYDSLAWKLCVAPLYASFHHLTMDFLPVFRHTKLLIVLHRKMIYNGSFCALKVLSKWKQLVAFILALLLNLRLSSQVMNQVSSLQKLPLHSICYCHASEYSSLTYGKNWIVVYNHHAWKLQTTIIYVISYPLTKGSLMFLHHVVLVVVLHRKMIYKCSFHVPKVLTKLKDWPPKHGSRKFAANVDLVVAILHRKMIERGKCSCSYSYAQMEDFTS